MIHRFLLLAGSALTMGPLALQAGGFSAEYPETKKKESSGDWCETLQDFGTLYDVKKKNNPYVQKVEIFGRYQQQWAYSDGSDRGRDFSGYGQELRRFRVGASVEFLDRWKIHGRINLEEGGFNDTKIRHDDFDELIIRYESKDLFFFNEPSIGYGLTKIDFGGEWYATSKEIKTVERSNLSNLYSPNRSTGFLYSQRKLKTLILFWEFSHLGSTTTHSQTGMVVVATSPRSGRRSVRAKRGQIFSTSMQLKWKMRSLASNGRLLCHTTKISKIGIYL